MLLEKILQWMFRFGSFSLILAILAWEVSKNLKKYQKLVILTAVWGIFHACLEIFSASTNPYNELFSQNPSIKVWIPQYNYNLILEAILLIFYAFVVFLWMRRKND